LKKKIIIRFVNVETDPRLGYGSQKQMQSKSKELKQGVRHSHGRLLPFTFLKVS
jgi:hypothetical protein